MSNRTGKSRKSKVGNRKAGSRNNNVYKAARVRSDVAISMPRQPRSQGQALARTRQYAQAPPKIRQLNHKSCRIVHRELIDTVTFPVAAPGFQPRQFPLNPGWDETFSWLSNMAINWERYKFHRLTFHYLTRSAATTSGSCMIAPDYDAADAAPLDELTMMSYEDAREDVVWKDIVVNCDVQSMSGGRKDHFVRTGALQNNLDIKTYDVGNLWVAFDRTGISTAPAGKLFVEYDVELFTPQLPPSGDPLIGSGRAINGGGGTTPTLPFGTVPLNGVGVNLGKLIVDGAGNNSMAFTQDVDAGVLDTYFTGTAITSQTTPTLLDGFGNAVSGTVSGLIPALVNAGSTALSQSFSLKGIKAGDIITFPGLSATTIATAVFNLNRGLLGVFPGA